MDIAIIGAGNVGAALARAFARAGHAVLLGVRDRAAEALRPLVAETGASAKSPADAARSADVVILALPWAAAKDAVAALGDLAGKIVIDCMNPLGMVDGALALTVGHTDSGGEMVARWLPGARVVKTLNQVGAEMMADNARLAHRPVVFMAGNDADAKATVAGLLADIGFDPLDAGDLSKSRLLEPFAMVWINQALLRGKGRRWAFAAVS